MTIRTIRPMLAVCLLLSSVACVVAVHSPPPVRHAPPAAAPPPPAVQADVGLFYDDLAPYGVWRYVDPYGWVWSPSGVQAGWRPYSEGRWVYSDYGWTWVSDWNWGWAPFHYGRWVVAAGHGWVWIPGTEWGPAWVAWRHGNGWVGWAPLPPQARWSAGVGLDFGRVNIDVAIRPAWWCFVQERYLVEPRISTRIAVSTRNVGIVHTTRHVTNYVVVDRRPFNRSIDVGPIERVTRKPVPHYRVVNDDASRGRSRARLEGRDLRIFRPEIDNTPPRHVPRAAPHEAERRTAEPNRPEPPVRKVPVVRTAPARRSRRAEPRKNEEPPPASAEPRGRAAGHQDRTPPSAQRRDEPAQQERPEARHDAPARPEQPAARHGQPQRPATPAAPRAETGAGSKPPQEAAPPPSKGKRETPARPDNRGKAKGKTDKRKGKAKKDSEEERESR